jgi:hypothetical protein
MLKRKYNPNSARPRIFEGAAEAKLIALTCSPAPEGFARSDNTIGRTLKKTSSNRTAIGNG